ncbi:MAG: glutathione ABC transporter substrate-binding protein [Spirochaetaceae bacterium]|nr:MAG: glutathione ABC transporter substrate-binding protein [Spirochaetaceae bacterium]
MGTSRFAMRRVVVLSLVALFTITGTALFATGQPQRAAATAGQNLIILRNSDIVSLDPHGSNDSPSSAVRSLIYDTLVYFDEDMVMQPGLATEWNLVNATTWEFKLRRGVTFHDGTPFTAEAVKLSLDRVRDPGKASQRAFLFNMVNAVTVVDDFTVRVATDFPFVPILSHLAHDAAGIISPPALRAAGYDEVEPVGTGPFSFVSWNPGDEVVVARYAGFWGDAPTSDTVTFRVVPEESTRLALIERGDAHIAEIMQPASMARVEASRSMSLELFDSLSLNYIGFNVNKAPFDDVRVRQAVSMAIDRQSMIDGIVEGAGVTAIGTISERVFGFHPTLSSLPFDPARARQLLADAGLSRGFTTTLWTNDNPTRIAIAEIVQNNLAEVGITVNIEVLEWGAYLAQTAEGLHDMFILGWVTVTADADYGMYALLHSSNHGAAGNRSFFASARVDELLDLGRREANLAARERLYHEAQEILVNEAPMLNLYHPKWMIALANGVTGYAHHPDNTMLIRNVIVNR